jgi:hypothetical protein
MNESGYAAFKAQFTFNQELIDDLLHYGYTESDFKCENDFGSHRVRVIRHDKTNKIYWLRQYNGDTVEFWEVN